MKPFGKERQKEIIFVKKTNNNKQKKE